MSVARSLAGMLSSCAATIAPPEKAEWVRGMQAELSAVRTDGAALNWSAGCLMAAVGWRLWDEAIYVLLFVLIALRGYDLTSFYFIGGTIDPSTNADITISNLVAGSLAFAICLYRPRRAILTALLVPFFFYDFRILLTHAWATPVALIFTREVPLDGWLRMMFRELWPAATGASLAWLVVRLWAPRRLRRPVSQPSSTHTAD